MNAVYWSPKRNIEWKYVKIFKYEFACNIPQIKKVNYATLHVLLRNLINL